MKTIVKEKETKKLEFPCLMKTDNGLVVLFTSNNSGTVIVSNEYHKLVKQSLTWDMECFTPFEGEIILSND